DGGCAAAIAPRTEYRGKGVQSSVRRPPNRAEKLALKSRVAPGLRKVPERIVVGAARAVRLRPCERIVARRADGFRVQPQQHMHARPWIVAERVELLHHREAAAETRGRRMRLILDDHAGALRARMLLEIGADELAVLRPLVQRVG